MRNKTKRYVQILGVAAIGVLVFWALFSAPWEHDIEQGKTSTEEVGKTMFEDYHLAFLFIGFILFSAMLGGMFLAKDDESRERSKKGGGLK